MNKKQKAMLVIWLICMFFLLLQAPRHIKDNLESGKIKRNHGSYSLLYPPPFYKENLYNISSSVPAIPVFLAACLSGGLFFLFRDKKRLVK